MDSNNGYSYKSDGKPYNNSNRKQPSQQLVADFGIMPPMDTDLEEAVLGALMLEKDAYTVVCDLLKPESFYEPGQSANI